MSDQTDSSKPATPDPFAPWRTPGGRCSSSLQTLTLPSRQQGARCQEPVN